MTHSDKELVDLISKMVLDGLKRDGWAPGVTVNGLPVVDLERARQSFARERANNIMCVIVNERELAREELADVG